MTATGSTLADEWIDYYYCDSLQDGVLLKKAQKQHSKNSSNTKGNEKRIKFNKKKNSYRCYRTKYK